jgi:hypothetical protein
MFLEFVHDGGNGEGLGEVYDTRYWLLNYECDTSSA